MPGKIEVTQFLPCGAMPRLAVQRRGREADDGERWTGRHIRPRLAPLIRRRVPMASIAMVSIVCRDGVGLVSAIADYLFSAGINLRDTTFAALGKGAEFTAICELPAGLTVGELKA